MPFRVIALMLLPIALLLSPRSARANAVLDFQGYAWWEPGAPPATPGARCSIVFRADRLAEVIGIALDDEEVTGYATALVLVSVTDVLPGVRRYDFSSGEFSLFHDPARNHDFGIDPPNATVPATFVDGALCTKGLLQNVVFFEETATETGAFEASLYPDSGCLHAVHTPETGEALTVFGATLRNIYGSLPHGYSYSIDGTILYEILPWFVGLPSFRLTSWDIPGAGHLPQAPFSVGGEFVEGEMQPSLDRCRWSAGVSIGEFSLLAPANRLREQALAGGRTWRYSDPDQLEGIQTMDFEFLGNGRWRFAIAGRGVPRARLLRDDRILDVTMAPGAWYWGRDQVVVTTASAVFRTSPRINPMRTKAQAESVAWSRIKQLYR